MSTNLNQKSRSWFQIMWQNGYIQVLSFLLGFMALLWIKRAELIEAAPIARNIAWLILMTGVGVIIGKGFIQFWNVLNGSKGWRVWTIKQGKQRSSWFRTPWFYRNTFIRNWKLLPSCAYKPRMDHWINKIWGIGFGLLPKKIDGKWVPAHHVNSARFGWEPHPIQQDCFTLMVYIYDDGVRIADEIAVIKYDDTMRLDIKRTGPRSLSMQANGAYFSHEYVHFFKKRLPRFGYRLGFTYGGEPQAPHNMQAWEQKA